MNDDLNTKLDALLKAIEKEGIEILTPDEIASLRELSDVERAYPGAIRSTARIHHAIQATGFLANGVYGVLRWLAGAHRVVWQCLPFNPLEGREA